ncbi:MAG: hypothetical protein ACYTF3_00335 [Planctomycetota bacterium]
MDDAEITLRTLAQAIRGDARSWCRVRLLVTGDQVQLSEGDPVFVWLAESDLFGNQELWATDFRVTAEEAAAQVLDRELDCSARFGDDDFLGGLDIFAAARVEKAQCGFWCRWDRPSSGQIEVEVVDDDNAEDDDNDGAAVLLPPGTTPDRVARDQDWVELEIFDRSDVAVSAIHPTGGGRLDVSLFHEDGTRISAGEDLSDRTRAAGLALDPAIYRARISPRQGDDFNFYDVEVRTSFASECEPGEVDEQPCGNCGIARRTCGEDARWAPTEPCAEEGACGPGDEQRVPCGRCGSRIQRCTDACAWDDAAACEGEGSCVPGQVDEVACDDTGVRRRVCDETCEWEPFSDCAGGAACEDGTSRPCYPGPMGTEGVGDCGGGMQKCEATRWLPCEGAVTPTFEVCDDGADNDCDGAADDADPECDGAPRLGDPCGADDDCGDPFECLGATPDEQIFTAGYCGDRGCRSNCGVDGVCGTAFGQSWCLRACIRPDDCRAGHRCTNVGAGRLACVPACRNDDDCRDPAFPVCEGSGVCVPPEGLPPRPDIGPAPSGGETRRDARVDDPDAPVDLGPAEREASEDCNCTAGGRSATVPLLLLGLLLLGGRRRSR